MLLIVGAASVGLAVELDPDMINVSYIVATLFFYIFTILPIKVIGWFYKLGISIIKYYDIMSFYRI